MAVSGKTAAPHEIPYFLGTDKPPDMAAGTKAIADRVHARLGAVDLSQLVAGTENNGKLVVVNSGAAAYKAMSGDVTMDSAGVATIGAKKVTTAKLNDAAVTDAKLGESQQLRVQHDLRDHRPCQQWRGRGLIDTEVRFLAERGRRGSPGTCRRLFGSPRRLPGPRRLRGRRPLAKLRLRWQLMGFPVTVAEAPVVVTAGLYFVPGFSPMAGTTSTFTFNSATPGVFNSTGSADFAMPEEGFYVAGVKSNVGWVKGCAFSWQLLARNV